jgi:hypothetical protein
MSLTYQSYILSMDTEFNEDSDFDFESESDDWDQYIDIESQTIINSKNRYHMLTQSRIQFRQYPANKFFKRKNANVNANVNANSKSKIDILESIKEEEPELFEDIETGKLHNNTKKNEGQNLRNLQQIVVTSLIYISHIALFTFVLKS